MRRERNDVISVVMSVYNECEEDLRQAIESILCQTYSDFEFIIVNDNPANLEIQRILQEYMMSDARIRLLENEQNIGLARSLNRAIEKSRGEYIARMDGDDISLPFRLEKELEFLKENNLDLVSGLTVIIDEKGCEISANKDDPRQESVDLSRALPVMNQLSHPAALGKRSAFTDVEGYRNFPSTQDYDIWLRMLTAKKKIGRLGQIVLKYRSRRGNITNRKRYEQHLIDRYVRNMYIERMKNGGQDSFSEENLKLFLEQNDVTSLEKQQKYQMKFDLCNESLKAFKEGNVIKGIQGFLKLLVDGKDGRELLQRAIYTKYMLFRHS